MWNIIIILSVKYELFLIFSGCAGTGDSGKAASVMQPRVDKFVNLRLPLVTSSYCSASDYVKHCCV